jgi:hypothetical protein
VLVGFHSANERLRVGVRIVMRPRIERPIGVLLNLAQAVGCLAQRTCSGATVRFPKMSSLIPTTARPCSAFAHHGHYFRGWRERHVADGFSCAGLPLAARMVSAVWACRLRGPGPRGTVMKLGRAVSVIAVLLFGTPDARGEPITFDSVPTDVFEATFSVLAVGGFLFESNHAHIVTSPTTLCELGCADNGTQWIGGDTVDISVTHANGSSFSLFGFDAAEAFAGVQTPDSLQLRGTQRDGRMLTASFIFDGINDSAFGPLQDFQTFTLGDDWNHLTSVSFFTHNSGWFGIDNVDVAPVPEPTSVVMLATGLIALVPVSWRARRERLSGPRSIV